MIRTSMTLIRLIAARLGIANKAHQYVERRQLQQRGTAERPAGKRRESTSGQSSRQAGVVPCTCCKH